MVSKEFVTVDVNDLRWLRRSESDGGETLTVTLLMIVTAAEAVTGPPGELAVACIVTGFGDGRLAGAE